MRRATNRLTAAWVLIGTLAWLACLSPGCEVDKGVAPENLPPETWLFVRGDSLSTRHYRQIINWWATDSDGFVVGYAYRWSHPWTPEAGDSVWVEADSSRWVWTTASRDTFNLPVRGTFARLTFEVKAMDDAGAFDPTPASQTFGASNHPPTVEWSRYLALPQRSLPAASFAWSPDDPDGAETVTRALLWLEGDSARSVQIVERDTIASVLPEQFGGVYGERTLKLQVFDEAATGSNVIEHTWIVEDPGNKTILLIDNCSSGVPGYDLFDDPFYRDILEAVRPGQTYILDIETDGGFRAPPEVLPLFDMFDAVVWYSGPAVDANDALVYENLLMAEAGIEAYLERGGRILLCATNLFGTNGGLSSSFFRDTAGLDTLYTWLSGETATSNITLRGGRPVLVDARLRDPAGGEEEPPDTLLMQSTARNVEFFSRPADDASRLFWLAPATLDTTDYPQQRWSEFHCGVRRDLGPGRLALATFPLSRAGRAGNHEEAGEALVRWLLEE